MSTTNPKSTLKIPPGTTGTLFTLGTPEVKTGILFAAGTAAIIITFLYNWSPLNALSNLLHDGFGGLKDLGSKAIDGVKDAGHAVVEKAKETAGAVVEDVKTTASTTGNNLLGVVKHPIETIENTTKAVEQVATGTKTAWEKIDDATGGKTVSTVAHVAAYLNPFTIWPTAAYDLYTLFK
jgi:hypothetical protein